MPNFHKSCPNMISLEKWRILTPLQKLPNNVGNLGKIIVAIGFEWLPKVQKITQSGHTGSYLKLNTGGVQSRDSHRDPLHPLVTTQASFDDCLSLRLLNWVVLCTNGPMWLELRSRTANGRWRLVSAQLSNELGYCPSCTDSIVLPLHKHNSLPLGQMQAFLSFY